MNGRCVSPCPNPGVQFGGCPTDYTCVPLTDGSNVCAPRSDDCTNLFNYVPASPGQACSTQSCTNNALCIGGVCSLPCPAFMASGCPAGQFCGFIGLPDSPFFICGTPVDEGEACSGGDLCTVGLCLNDGSGSVCRRNCGSGVASSACQGSQTCQNVALQGGQSIDICDPAQIGPPPPPDAGVRDTGVVFPDAQTGFPDAQTGFPDAMTQPNPDASTNPGDDATTEPTPDSGISGNTDGGVGPGADGSAGSSDASRPSGPTGGGSVVRRSSGCTCVSAPAPMHPLMGLLLVAPALVLVRRRLSGPRTRRS